MGGGSVKRTNQQTSNEGSLKKTRVETNVNKNYLFSNEHEGSSSAEDDGVTTEEEKDI